MGKQRWLGWVDPDDREMLQAARAHLKKTWEWDREDPGHYPLNTSWALENIRQLVLKTPITQHSRKRHRMVRKPRRFADLVSEGFVANIWESQNTGTYKAALVKAAALDFDNTKSSWKVFKSIIRAIEAAYIADFLGWEFLPKPKINILHAGLKNIAIAAGLEDQTQQGFAEFLDGLCPCGIKDHAGAVRQLSRRSAART